MFDFLIAVFGGAYLGEKCLKSKEASERAYWDAWNKRVSEETWAIKHTDSAVESSLLKIMDDPTYLQEISREVLSAFAKMPSWSYRDSIVIRADQLSANMAKANVQTRRSFIIRERNIALDIMLANRGKVSTAAANFGYDVPNRALYAGSGLDRRDELARWIEDTLRGQGIDVKLTYKQNEAGDRKYVWVGSHAHSSTLEF